MLKKILCAAALGTLLSLASQPALACDHENQTAAAPEKKPAVAAAKAAKKVQRAKVNKTDKANKS